MATMIPDNVETFRTEGEMRFYRFLDSVANSSLTQQFRWNDRYEVIEKPKIADEEFYWYVLRFWQFYRELKAKRPKATVKLADYYLLYSWQ